MRKKEAFLLKYHNFVKFVYFQLKFGGAWYSLDVILLGKK